MATLHGSSENEVLLLSILRFCVAEIFRHHYETLVNATAPVHRAIACRLYTAGWICKPTKNDATSVGISPELAAMQVVNDLETNLTTKLRSDPDPVGVIVELCCCLENDTNYRTIVQSIRRELSQLQDGVGRRTLVSQEEKRKNTLEEGEQCQEKEEKEEDEDVKRKTKLEENKERVDRQEEDIMAQYHELMHKNESLRLEMDGLEVQKNCEIDQLKLALRDKEHELSEMQTALDKLQHRPDPKPHAPAADTQVVKNLHDQLSLTQRQLEEAVEELTKARNTHATHIAELRAKLNEVTALNRKEIDRLNTEIYEFKAKNETLSTKLDAAKSKVHELEINNRELIMRRVNQGRTFTPLPPRVTVVFNLDSVMYELQRVKFPVAKWIPLSIELELMHITYSINIQFRDDARKLHGLISYWVDNTKDSDPWITLVKAVDRIGEHDVAAEIATAVGVPQPDKSTADSFSKEAHEEPGGGQDGGCVDEVTQQTLTSVDLLDVLEQLSDLTVSKYRRLGLKLGLKSSTLSKLEADDELGWHVMEAWLNQEDNVKNPTWKCLIAALQSPYVGQNVTAQRVRQWLTSR